MTTTPARYRRWAATVLLCLAGGAVPGLGATAAAQDTQLDQVERALEKDQAEAQDLARKAAALRNEIQGLRRELVAAARKAQNLEDALSTKEQALSRLESERALKQAALAKRHGQLARTLGALQRIAVRPPEALIAAPGNPVDTVRSALLLRVAVPAIELQARELRRELDYLDQLRRDISLQRSSLETATRELEGERLRLSRLIERKRDLQDLTTAEQRAAHARARKLARQAKSLRDLVAKLEDQARANAGRETREAAEPEAVPAPARDAEAQAEPKAPKTSQQALLTPPTPLEKPGNVRRFPDRPSAANLVMPARGSVVTTFGDRASRNDQPAQGISIRTRGLAQIVAPYDGRVAYAGDFRGYGQILIIEHGGRYHTLLAGLGRIDAVVGQWVLAGEPVGTMGRVEDSEQVLYLELRQTGQPVNPLPWFANSNNKVQG